MTATLVWQIVSWLLSGAVSGLVVAFVYGRSSGRWQATIESQIAGATKSRESIHRELERITTRLDRGDREFDQHLERLATGGAHIMSLTAEIKLLRADLANLVTHEECNRRHTAKGATS